MNRYSSEEGELLRYIFTSSGTNTLYQRQVFNVFDALTGLGGVFTALSTAGVVFTSIFSYRLMMSSLIGKLFHFRHKPGYTDIKKKKKKKK